MDNFEKRMFLDYAKSFIDDFDFNCGRYHDFIDIIEDEFNKYVNEKLNG